MDRYYIPKYLDEPFKVAFFTLDEIAVLVLSVFLNLFLTGGVGIGIFFGAILVALLKKIKGNEGHNQLLRIVYWYLPPLIRFKSTPPSHVREILG